MKIVVLTLASFATNARAIGGPKATVLTQYDPDVLNHTQLLFIFLHPSADGQKWLDDHQAVVLDVERIRRLRLNGTIVFVGACYGKENQVLLSALWDAGVKAIISGPGINIGGSGGVLAGADVLAVALRSWLEAGFPLRIAWGAASFAAHLAAVRGIEGAEDSLTYQLEVKPMNPLGKLTGLLAVAAVLWTLITGGASAPLTLFSSVVPTATPTSTPTPAATPTPPMGWEPPLPIFGSGSECCPYHDSRAAYTLYFPVVLRNFPPSGSPPTQAATPTGTPTPTEALTPTPIPTPTLTPSPTPLPSPTPTPTPLPTLPPSPTPTSIASEW